MKHLIGPLNTLPPILGVSGWVPPTVIILLVVGIAVATIWYIQKERNKPGNVEQEVKDAEQQIEDAKEKLNKSEQNREKTEQQLQDDIEEANEEFESDTGDDPDDVSERFNDTIRDIRARSD